MSSSDTLPTYRGVLNDTTWTDASALAFPADAIVGVYVQAFTPIVTLDSDYLSLGWWTTTGNAPYAHGTLTVDYTSTSVGVQAINRQLNWANLVKSFMIAGSRISLSTPDAAHPYTQVSFSWPSPTDGLVVLSDTTDGLRTLAAGSGGKYLYQDSTWQQVGWSQLSGVPSWLNATYTQYGVTYATTTSAMGTTGAGTSTSQFLRSGGGAAAPDFKQVDMKDLTGITWGTGLNKVAYTPDGAGKALAFSNAVAASKYLGYNSGVPGFVAIPYTDISGTPTLPTVSATANQTTVTYSAPDYKVGTVQDIGTGSSPTFAGLTLSDLTAHTALYADASKVVKSATINTLATKMYLQQYSSGDPQFAQVSCADLTGTLAVANGGTGKASWTQYLIPYADTTTSFSQIGIGSSGQVLTSGGPGVAPSFAALPTAVTISATANQTTVSGGPAYTVGTVQNIDTAADVRFGYLSVGSARVSNYANRIANTATAAAGQSPYGLVLTPTLTRADTNASIGFYCEPTYNIGAFAGGAVYSAQFKSGSKSGAGSIASAYNVLIEAPVAGATNGLALYVDSIGVANSAWTDSTTASGTIKANRVGIGQNPDATKVLVATGNTSLTGTLTVSSTITASILTASRLVATDGSSNLTSTTSGLTPTLAGVNFGNTSLSYYREYSWSATVTWYKNTGLSWATGTNATCKFVRIGSTVTMKIPNALGTAPGDSYSVAVFLDAAGVPPTTDIELQVVTYASGTKYQSEAYISSSGFLYFWATFDHAGFWPSGATSCFYRDLQYTWTIT